jgi:hypothetical protein
MHTDCFIKNKQAFATIPECSKIVTVHAWDIENCSAILKPIVHRLKVMPE